MLYHIIICFWIHILKISPLNSMFYIFLTYMPIFIQIRYYLPFDPPTHHIYWGSTWLSPIPPQTQTYPSTLKPMARCTPICKLMLLQTRLHNLVQNCLHNINQRLPNCVSTILLEALTHAQCQTSSPPLLAQHIFYVGLIGERERERVSNVEVILQYLVNTVLYFTF